MNTLHIKPTEIPDADYETGCSVLNTSVKHFFSLPGIQEEYEAWLKTEEGMKADLLPKERSKKWKKATQSTDAFTQE